VGREFLGKTPLTKPDSSHGASGISPPISQSLLLLKTTISIMPINRITLFKIPKLEDQDATLEAYRKLAAEQKKVFLPMYSRFLGIVQLQLTFHKDGKPYILLCTASKLYDDPRSQGYTICAQTSFASLDDMKYYDEQCEAHKTLKTTVGPKAVAPPITMYMDA
jgi:hypothetical protein